jgi:hypothetical protein
MIRSILHKLLLARRLYELSRENLSSANDLSLGIGVILLQDAVESFLLAVSEHVNAGIQSGTNYDRYFDFINSKISPKELPFRARLVALNKLRVNSKHYGLAPAKSETEGLLVTVREFLNEVTESVLGVNFATVSLIDLARDGESKGLLKEAEAAFQAGDFEKCLIDCRKAVFVRIESRYDIAPFAHGEEANGLGLFLPGRKAPFFARNKDYIDKNVQDPTDYVVIDHDDLELDLLKSGMDSVSFWNVWRLTPEVYRRETGGRWVVKREFKKLEEAGIRERAEYVLDTTINLFVTADQKLAATKSPEQRQYYIDLRKQEVPVYRKADVKSEVVSTTPKGVTRLYVDFMVPALSGKGNFWHVAHLEEGIDVWGYIPEDAVNG